MLSRHECIKEKTRKHIIEVFRRYNESPSKIKDKSSKDIAPSVAQQLLCARPSADMHMHNTCCAHVTQLMGGNMITIPQCFGYGRILPRLISGKLEVKEELLE